MRLNGRDKQNPHGDEPTGDTQRKKTHYQVLKDSNQYLIRCDSGLHPKIEKKAGQLLP